MSTNTYMLETYIRDIEINGRELDRTTITEFYFIYVILIKSRIVSLYLIAARSNVLGLEQLVELDQIWPCNLKVQGRIFHI